MHKSHYYPISASHDSHTSRRQQIDNMDTCNEITPPLSLLINTTSLSKREKQQNSGEIMMMKGSSYNTNFKVKRPSNKSSPKQTSYYNEKLKPNCSFSNINQIDTNIIMESAPAGDTDASRRKSSDASSPNPEYDAENSSNDINTSNLWARIDAFEMLREKITGITRSMQEFQIQELLLLQDDLDDFHEIKKYTMERSNSCLSPVSMSSSFSSSIPPSGLSRFSLVRSDSVSSAFSNITPHVPRSRQTTRSQCCFSPAASSNGTPFQEQQQQHQDSNGISEKEDQLDLLTSYSQHPSQRSQQHNHLDHEKLDFSNYKISAWSQLEVDGKEQDSGSSGCNSSISGSSRSISPLSRSVGPNAAALFSLSSDIIHSKLDELSETISMASSPSTMSFNLQEEESREWKSQYMNLITTCINQSEQLENLSNEALWTEKRVRELMLINSTVDDQFRQRERQYEERIRECQEVSLRQLHMIDSLEELAADINMKLDNPESSRDAAKNLVEHSRELDNETTLSNLNRKKSISEYLKDKTDDVVHKLRWDIGMFVGGGVGTGHVVHSFKGSLKGTDILITGSGATRVSQHDSSIINMEERHSVEEQHEQQQAEFSKKNTQESVIVTTKDGHYKIYQYRYMLHINSKERRTQFVLLPKYLWIPDSQESRCQYQYQAPNSRKRGRRCETNFSFFNRRHHCRRCGYVLCQQHSANQLPLFSSETYYSIGKWSRICDNCFRYLIR